MSVKEINVADSIFEVDLSISPSHDATSAAENEATWEYSNKYLLYCSKIDRPKYLWERFNVVRYHREIQSDL